MKKTHASSTMLADALEDHSVLESRQAAAANHSELIVLAQELRSLDDRKKEIAEEEKSINERMDLLKKTLLPDLMRKLGLVVNNLGSFTFEGGKIHLSTTLYASVADKEGFFGWLRKNKHADLIQETVNAQTVAAFVREQRTLERPDPPHLNINEITAAKLTKK